MKLALPLALMFALASCMVEVDYGPTQFKCGVGDTCPLGQTCVATQCVANTPSDAGVDALTADSAPADATAVANLLPNSGLETGNAPWESFVATLRGTTTMPHTGLRAVVVCKNPTGALGVFTAYADIVNGPIIPVGARFRASVWVRKSFDPLEAAPPSLKLVLRERGAPPNRDHSGPELSPITTNWVQLTAEMTVVDSGRDQINLLIWPGDVADGVCFAFDDAVGERL